MKARFAVIGIVVADMARSLAFYRELGLDLPASADAEGHVEHVLPGGVKLAWDTEATIASFTPDFTPPAPGGRLSLAFEAEGPAEVDALHEHLVGLGHHSELAPFDAFWGQRYAVVLDPDGNGVDLFAAR
ncbi:MULTISPECIES: VOC family protein [unclassified Crossiella]|uniref:VOC family protein n=1 Tax=unclassified Crossiella TaxID=2620835 RepID=UPI0020000BB8|nr:MULTISPECIES: VOC family protein [unclassified Crossiella]MCK2243135.1 VOC family protein [Crossiella sp. S99.2]MCK2257012.1 VOC family protein [Crossiella sp. S99.1]